MRPVVPAFEWSSFGSAGVLRVQLPREGIAVGLGGYSASPQRAPEEPSNSTSRWPERRRGRDGPVCGIAARHAHRDQEGSGKRQRDGETSEGGGHHVRCGARIHQGD